MADNPRPGPESQDSYDLGEAGGDLALRAEMGVQEALLRWWKPILASVIAVVLGFVVYGWNQSMAQAQARATASAIADAQAPLPDKLLMLAQSRAGMGEAPDPETLTPVADALVDVGHAHRGAGAVEALLRAAELYRLADQPAPRRAALEKAVSLASGPLAFAAGGALANLDIEEGNVEEGLTRMQALTKLRPEFLARQATLDLAAAQEAAGREDDARATYQRFLATWPDAPETGEVKDRIDRVGEGARPAPPAQPAVVEPAPDAAEQEPPPSQDAAGTAIAEEG